MKTLPVAFLAPIVAFAAPLYVATSPDGSSCVTLTDEAGPCVGSARLAVWVSKDARESVRGCYTVRNDGVYIAFLDGDIAMIPLGALKRPTLL